MPVDPVSIEAHCLIPYIILRTLQYASVKLLSLIEFKFLVVVYYKKKFKSEQVVVVVVVELVPICVLYDSCKPAVI